jgi:ubiquinone/menaquinone biosynthesis C-methylase UbiE
LGHDRVAAARFVPELVRDASGPVLDVGTGKGLLAIELARTGRDVVSVDVDEDEQALAMLLAREGGVADRIRFVCLDAAHLAFPDGAFGCAAMLDVLHHLEQAGPLLREMARVVAPGGPIVVADFDQAGFDLVARVHQGEGRHHPRTKVTVEQAENELGAVGFRLVTRAEGCLQRAIVMAREPKGVPAPGAGGGTGEIR